MIRVRLSLELVPETAFASNLRNIISVNQWNSCKRFAAKRAKNKCEICGGVGDKWPVECHERWEYILNRKASSLTDMEYIDKNYHKDLTGTQKLVGLIALCPACHYAKHYGYAQISGNEHIANAQLLKVNGWTQKILNHYLLYKFEQWQLRSAVTWQLDTSWFDENYETIKKSLKTRI